MTVIGEINIAPALGDVMVITDFKAVGLVLLDGLGEGDAVTVGVGELEG